MTQTKAPAVRPSRPVVNPVIDSADALLRSAVESCRQHERVGRLIEKQCSDEELASVAELCDICNKPMPGWFQARSCPCRRRSHRCCRRLRLPFC